jgi:hypothetical protein
MELKSAEISALPDDLKKELSAFCEDIINLIKTDLASIVLYGGITKEEFDRNSSNINLMIVLKNSNAEILDKITPRIQKGVNNLTLAPFLLTEEDLKSSFNLFPIKFSDIKKHHLLFWGYDYLSELTISPEFLKRNCQRELKNILLRLNQIYFFNYGFMENVGASIKKLYSSFLVNLNTLLFLQTGQHYKGKQQIIDASVRDLNLDSKIMNLLMEYKKGNVGMNNAELKTLFDQFIQVLRAASSTADKLK